MPGPICFGPKPNEYAPVATVTNGSTFPKFGAIAVPASVTGLPFVCAIETVAPGTGTEGPPTASYTMLPVPMSTEASVDCCAVPCAEETDSVLTSVVPTVAAGLTVAVNVTTSWAPAATDGIVIVSVWPATLASPDAAATPPIMTDAAEGVMPAGTVSTITTSDAGNMPEFIN